MDECTFMASILWLKGSLFLSCTSDDNEVVSNESVSSCSSLLISGGELMFLWLRFGWSLALRVSSSPLPTVSPPSSISLPSLSLTSSLGVFVSVKSSVCPPSVSVSVHKRKRVNQWEGVRRGEGGTIACHNTTLVVPTHHPPPTIHINWQIYLDIYKYNFSSTTHTSDCMYIINPTLCIYRGTLIEYCIVTTWENSSHSKPLT